MAENGAEDNNANIDDTDEGAQCRRHGWLTRVRRFLLTSRDRLSRTGSPLHHTLLRA